MEKKAQEESSKETFKLPSSSQRIRMSRTNSKEKLSNDQQKIKISTSKLPRIIRMPTRYYKPIENASKSNDDSGDSFPGPSKLEGVPMKMKKDDNIMIPERLKISHIPRLKSQRDGSKESSVPLNKSRPSNPPPSSQFMPECRNVQRVNIFVSPEFCSDERGPPASVQATRPIPTLGQIYGRMNMIDSDRLNDWFMELRTPINSIRSSNTRTSSAANDCNTPSSSTAYPRNSQQEELPKTSTKVIQDTKKNLSSESKTTNDNIGAWLAPDIELPTRDNEPGTPINTTNLNNAQKSKILSIKTSPRSKTLVLKKSQESQAEEGITMSANQTYCVGLSMDTAPMLPTPKIGVECSTVTSSLLSRPTVVICGTPAPERVEEGTLTSKSFVSMKPSQLSKTDATNNACCSHANPPTVTAVPRVPVPSYTDCLSEVLQKTTNFEVYQGIEVNRPSTEATNIEMGDKASVVGTKDATAECDADDSTTFESTLTKSKTSDDTTLLKSDNTMTQWSCRYQSEHSSEYTCRDSFGRQLSKRYYGDSRNNEMRERCKKCQRFKRFPSTRYKLPRSFGAWRSGGSIRRLCCRRFNHVWKKTTERWAIWSTRSTAKSRIFRKMFVQNLVRAVVWEDENVQTNMLVYNEIGTDGTVIEHKSAAISTMFNMATFQAIADLTDSGSKASNISRQANSGPSMFPFLSTKGKSSNITTTDQILSGFQFPYCLQNNCTSFTFNNDAALGMSKSTKSCQYEDIAERVEQTTSLLNEMEVNLADQPTDTEGLPNFKTDEKTSTPAPAQAPKQFSMHEIQTIKDICNTETITSITQNADTEALKNLKTDEKTSTLAPAPILLITHQIQANNNKMDADTQNAEIQNQPNLTDEKTSTLAPAPKLFSSHEMQTNLNVCNMDTVTENAEIQNLPILTDEKTSTLAPAPKLFSSHEMQTNQNVCNMDTVTENADTQDLQNFKPEEKKSMPVQAQTLFSAHEIQTNQVVCSMDAVTQNVITCQNADTQGQPISVADEKTSALAPAPIHFSTHQMQTKKDAGKAEAAAVAKNVIMCNNAEADLKFPLFGNSSSTTMPSGSDITYYRPVAGSDITHLISESRTQQALYPILRKYYSNAASTGHRDRDHLIVADSATQISPGDSVETVSIGVATSIPLLAVQTTTYSIDTLNVPTGETTDGHNTPVQRFDMSTQFEELESTPAEEMETQVTPLTVASIVSTGITPSQKGDEEVFMSQCVLMSSEKANLAVQTIASQPRLAFTGPKIMSISSGELSFNTPKSTTVERAQGSDYIVASNSTAIGSNEVIQTVASSETVPSNETESSNCYCDVDEACSASPCHVVSCGTDPNINVFNYNRSTSAGGLDSYYETELLLNNLIKKALIGSNVTSQHTHVSDKSNTSSKSRPNVYVSTSTNTHVGLETKSIGPTPSDMSKLTEMNKTDAEIQYIEEKLDNSGNDRNNIISRCMQNQRENDIPTQTEGLDKFEAPALHKSASMMTSYCGLAESIQVPAMSAMSVKNGDSRSSQHIAPHSSSGMMNLDMETNTNYQQGPLTENLAQTSVVQTQQKSLEVKIFRNCASKRVSSKEQIRNSVNEQLISLSRLLGKKRTEPSVHSQVEDKWASEYPHVDPGPQQKKFSNTFSYNSKKAFDSLMLSDEENQKRKSCSFSLKTEPDHNPMPYELPTLVLSSDSLADVLPILKSKEVFHKKSETDLALSPIMVDHFTSDNYVSKDVRESMLQACPEICDTGTESLTPTYSKKSACVLTTQCVLPPPPLCSVGHLYKPKSRGCVFVYGEPRCVVHKDCVDAAIQHELPNEREGSLKRERVTHSVGQLTSQSSLRDPSALIREVLSPKVYKALYETTKLVVSKDTKPSSIHSNLVARVDAEVDAAKFDSPKLRSASVLTSEVVMGSKSRCQCKEKGSVAHCKRTMQLAKNSEESHGDSSLVSHVESNEGDECCEACMRRHLVTSCRYYSNLLTKQLDRVRQNLTRHLGATSIEKIEQPQTIGEACTMKPSGRNAFATQTLKHSPYYPSRHMSCMLSPATSLTNICKYDKAHLKSVYYMLSAIEGRLRRMKLNSPSSYCQ